MNNLGEYYQDVIYDMCNIVATESEFFFIIDIFELFLKEKSCDLTAMEIIKELKNIKSDLVDLNYVCAIYKGKKVNRRTLTNSAKQYIIKFVNRMRHAFDDEDIELYLTNQMSIKNLSLEEFAVEYDRRNK